MSDSVSNSARQPTEGDEDLASLGMGFLQDFKVLTYSIFTLAIILGLWFITKIVYMIYKIGRDRNIRFRYFGGGSDRDTASRSSEDSRNQLQNIRFGPYTLESQRLRGHSVIHPEALLPQKGTHAMMMSVTEPEQFPETSTTTLASERISSTSSAPRHPPPPTPLSREDLSSVTL